MLAQSFSETTEVKEVIKESKKIFDILLSPQLQKMLFPLKVACLLFLVLFLMIFIYLLAKTDYINWRFLRFLKDFLSPKIFRRKRLIQKWKKIKAMLEKDSDAQWKLALVESATLLDDVLKSRGYGGENLEERLKKLTTDDVSNLSQLLEAQQVCRDILRDPDYKLEKTTAKNVIETFEKSLTDLEVL